MKPIRKTGARNNRAPSPKADKLAYSINDLHELGFGCRAYLYGDVNNGKLRATKRGRYTVILARDLDAWVASLPTIKLRSPMAAEQTNKIGPTARLAQSLRL